MSESETTDPTTPILPTTEESRETVDTNDSTSDTAPVESSTEETQEVENTNTSTLDSSTVEEDKSDVKDVENLTGDEQENPILLSNSQVNDTVQQEIPSHEEVISGQEEQGEGYDQQDGYQEGEQQSELRVQISENYDEYGGNGYEEGNLLSPGSFRSPKSRKNLRVGPSDNVLKDYYHLILPSSFVMFGVLCYVIFVYLDTFELDTVPHPSYFTRMIAFLFSTAFISICTTSFYSLWETADDPEKTASSYAATTLAFISWVTHIIIGFDLMPVVINWQEREMQTVRSLEWLVEVFIMILIIECLKWRGKSSVLCIVIQTAAQFCMAVGNIATEATYGIIFYLGAILLLYSNIGFLWYAKYKFVQAESKTKQGVDPEEKKSWILLNTYFWTQTLLIVCYILGYIGLFNGNFEALLISGLDLLSKIVYCSILTAKS